jgi:predicted transcriptional regulator
MASLETISNISKIKKKASADQAKSTYEAVYNILKKLENSTLPLSMSRITTNGNVKIFLVKNELVKEVEPKDNLKQEYLTYRYYSINPKGQEYIKRYESFKELIK